MQPFDAARRQQAAQRLSLVGGELFDVRAALDTLRPRTLAAREAAAAAAVDTEALSARLVAATRLLRHRATLSARPPAPTSAPGPRPPTTMGLTPRSANHCSSRPPRPRPKASATSSNSSRTPPKTAPSSSCRRRTHRRRAHRTRHHRVRSAVPLPRHVGAPLDLIELDDTRGDQKSS